MSNKELIHYGVVGCGFFGTVEAKVIDSLDNAKLVSIFSPSGYSAKRLSEDFQCDHDESLDQLVSRKDIDAIIVASPNGLHKEPVEKAAECGKHVFCEKPFSTSVRDAEEMIRACQANQVTLMVGHMMHFYPGILQIKKMLDENAIGKPMAFHVERTGWENKAETVLWKKMQDQSGGHLFHHIHEIDLLCWMNGPVKEVFAAGGNLAHRGEGFGDEDDVLLLTLFFENNSFGTMQYGSGFRLGEHFLKINGSKGGIYLDNKTSSICLTDENNLTTEYPLFEGEESNQSMIQLFKKTDGGVTFGRPGDEPEPFLKQAVIDELTFFTNVLLGKPNIREKPELFGGEAALHAVKVAQACLLSKKCGYKVNVDHQTIIK